MFIESTETTLPCSICLRAIQPDDQNTCSCGDTICESCPEAACSCADDGAEIHELKVELRARAIELAALQGEGEMMGYDSLTFAQQSRLRLLVDVVGSLSEEIDDLHEIEDAHLYEV